MWIFSIATAIIVWVLTYFGIRLSTRTTAILGGIEILIMLALGVTFLVHPGAGLVAWCFRSWRSVVSRLQPRWPKRRSYRTGLSSEPFSRRCLSWESFTFSWAILAPLAGAQGT